MKLIIEDDDGRRRVIPFAQDQISIGRDPGNAVRLTERNVSRRHALIVRDKDSIVIEDLGSTNGVRVNGDSIRGRTRIGHGDHIRIGDYDLALDDESRPERPTQPNLTPVPDTIGAPARGSDSPFAGLAAVARFKKAARIEGVFARNEAVGAKPQEAADPHAERTDRWPADFHLVAAGTVDQMRAAQIRRKRAILGALVGSVVLFAGILAFGLLDRSRSPASPVPMLAAAQAPVAPAPSPAPSVAPAAQQEAPSPVAAANSPEPPTKLAAVPAPSTEPHPSTPPTKRASSTDASHRKALNLYQDAVADVGNGDYSGALTKLMASAELDPSSPETQKELAVCYSHLRKPAKGASHYELYLKLRPDAPDAADVRKMLRDYHASKGAE